MKALRVHKDDGSFSLQVEDVPEPSPKGNELLVKIKASAVQPADILNSKGGFPSTVFPIILGKDFAGVVVEGPAQWKGKEVCGTSGKTFSFREDGAQAEFAVLQEDCVAPKPRNISFAQAAKIGTPWTTAYMTLQRASASPEDVVMVLGATGAVGSAIVQIAKSVIGCKVLGVGRHGTEVNSVEDPELQKAKDLTNGKGPDVVIDTVGDFNLTQAALKVMAIKGRMSIISAPRQGTTQLAIDIKDLYRRQISLIGVNSAGEDQSTMTKLLASLVPSFESGKLVPQDEKSLGVLSLEQYQDAYSGKVKNAVIAFD